MLFKVSIEGCCLSEFFSQRSVAVVVSQPKNRLNALYFFVIFKTNVFVGFLNYLSRGEPFKVLFCRAWVKVILPDAIQILLHEVIDAYLASWLQELYQIPQRVVEIREVLLVVIQMVDYKVASDEIELLFVLLYLPHVFEERALHDFNIFNGISLLFLSHLGDHAFIDLERYYLLDIFTNFKGVVA